MKQGRRTGGASVILPLLPYQRAGAAFLAERDRAALFDVMGSGKSAQAIAAMDKVGARRIVIVCPAAVREVWKGEPAKFSKTPRRIIKGRDIQDLNTWLRGKADVLLLSYEMAVKWAPRMTGDIIDVIVFDEAHYIKSPSAQRTISLLGSKCDGASGLARWGAYVWFLTGTPNPNDAADCWSIMRFCRATPLSRDTFCNRYFKSKLSSFSELHSPRKEKLAELKQALSNSQSAANEGRGRRTASADLADHHDRGRRHRGNPRPAARSPRNGKSRD